MTRILDRALSLIRAKLSYYELDIQLYWEKQEMRTQLLARKHIERHPLKDWEGDDSVSVAPSSNKLWGSNLGQKQ